MVNSPGFYILDVKDATLRRCTGLWFYMHSACTTLGIRRLHVPAHPECLPDVQTLQLYA